MGCVRKLLGEYQPWDDTVQQCEVDRCCFADRFYAPKPIVIGDDSRSLSQVTIILASSVVQCGEAF